MRVLIAPNDYKGSLSAVQAARALARGARRAGCRAVPLPLADGGPGTTGVLRAHLHGRWRTLLVPGPFGAATRARWADLGGGTAAFDVAEAVGIARLPAGRRDPWRASSAGVGALLLRIASAGFRRVLVGLGGTATVDGGLGAALLLSDGRTAAPLRDEDWADPASLRRSFAEAREALRGIELVALRDVDSPLLGPGGAAAVFGPQKGARPEDVPRLEARMRSLVDALSPEGAGSLTSLPGAGAAGGLGFAIAAWGGRLVAGADFLLEATDFDKQLAGCDLVVTGEGRVDRQTALGKLPYRVAQAAVRAGRPVLVVAGSLGPGWRACEDPERRVRVVRAAPEGVSRRDSMRDAARWLEDAAERLLGRAAAPELRGSSRGRRGSADAGDSRRARRAAPPRR